MVGSLSTGERECTLEELLLQGIEAHITFVSWLVLLELVLGQGVLVKAVSLAVGAVP